MPQRAAITVIFGMLATGIVSSIGAYVSLNVRVTRLEVRLEAIEKELNKGERFTREDGIALTKRVDALERATGL